MFFPKVAWIALFVSGSVFAAGQALYQEAQLTEDCGVDWDAKYGCSKGAKLKCRSVSFPVSRLGKALSIGSQTICSDGKNVDTARSMAVKDVVSGSRLGLDAMIPESLIARALFDNEAFRKQFKLTSLPGALAEHMASIPEVRNFGYSEFEIRASVDGRLAVDLFVRGDWEERDQKLSFAISVPEGQFADAFRTKLIRFGDYSAILNANSAYKKKDLASSAKYAAEYLRESDLSSENLAQFNDAGFFLEQANRATEAIPVLEKVVAFDPARIPAYLNLADAYQKAGDKVKAKANYQKYVELMEKAGKGAKVPARVRAFLKS